MLRGFAIGLWGLATVALVAISLSPTPSAQTSLQLTGVRLDDAFRPAGSDGTGLVVSLTIKELPRPSTTADFTVFVSDAQMRREGEVSCLAMRSLDGADPKRWVLLDETTGTLARSYRAMIESGAAIAERQRNKPIEKMGRYELVFLIGPTTKQGVLTYGDDRRQSARLTIGSFKVPSP